MMSAQRQVSAQQLPPSIEQPRNKKDELYNTLLGFLKKEQLCWTSSEVAHGVAASSVRILTDVLWFLDGHQSTLREILWCLTSLQTSIALSYQKKIN